MTEKLFELIKKPKEYAESSGKFWDDEHISKGMLAAHLNPNWDAASRKHEFIEKSVKWIIKNANKPKLLDLGCGPGIYAEEFHKAGAKVTGVDFSKRSIEYAKDSVKERDLDIEYFYKNYLELEYENAYDLITLIYCDYGVLSPEARKTLREKVYKALKPRGKFILDVFTPVNNLEKKETNTWIHCEKGGFWKPNEYLYLESTFIYPQDITLTQYTILENQDKVEVIRVWDEAFTKDKLIKEFSDNGFKNFEFYDDVSGKAFTGESKTMCIVMEK